MLTALFQNAAIDSASTGSEHNPSAAWTSSISTQGTGINTVFAGNYSFYTGNPSSDAYRIPQTPLSLRESSVQAAFRG